jgi:hypothetical protein
LLAFTIVGWALVALPAFLYLPAIAIPLIVLTTMGFTSV